MGTVLDVKFGRPLVVFEPRDVLDVIDLYCGEDIARYLRDIFDNDTAEERAVELQVNTDLDSYEAQLESNSRAFCDIREEVEALKKEIEGTRINRVKVNDRLRIITILIDNQI